MIDSMVFYIFWSKSGLPLNILLDFPEHNVITVEAPAPFSCLLLSFPLVRTFHWCPDNATVISFDISRGCLCVFNGCRSGGGIVSSTYLLTALSSQVQVKHHCVQMRGTLMTTNPHQKWKVHLHVHTYVEFRDISI